VRRQEYLKRQQLNLLVAPECYMWNLPTRIVCLVLLRAKA
jgi:hypothetical protein